MDREMRKYLGRATAAEAAAVDGRAGRHLSSRWIRPSLLALPQLFGRVKATIHVTSAARGWPPTPDPQMLAVESEGNARHAVHPQKQRTHRR